MVPNLLLLLIVFTLANEHNENNDECCKKKNVGGTNYVLSGKKDTSDYNCLNNCAYEKEGEPDSEYCFARGDDKAECLDTNGGKGCRCGMKRPESKIVGGQTTEIFEYPWMALVLALNDSFTVMSSCGGSIINSKWIITARHCIIKTGSLIMTNVSEIYPTTNIFVYIGDPRLSVTLLQAEKVVANPIDDLALIKVTEDIDTAIFSPICLPEAGNNFRAMDGVFIGLGANMSLTKNETFASNFPELLQEITLPILSAGDCNKYYLDLLNKSGVDQTNMTKPIVAEFLCAGGVSNRGGCWGDSGGPLMVQTPDKDSWTLAGTYSASEEPCAKEGAYGAFVEVENHLDFIKQTAVDGKFCN